MASELTGPPLSAATVRLLFEADDRLAEAEELLLRAFHGLPFGCRNRLECRWDQVARLASTLQLPALGRELLTELISTSRSAL